MSVWEYTSEEQKAKMEEPITRENWGKKLQLARVAAGLTRKEIAKVLKCSEATIYRNEEGKKQGKKEGGEKQGKKQGESDRTPDLMNRLAGLAVIGHAKYSKMTEEERNLIAETIRATGSVARDTGGAIGAILAGGALSGLSAAGIVSGLAAIGGCAMLRGTGVVAALPSAVAAAGYGLVKGIKEICEANNLSWQEVDDRYEIVPKPPGPDKTAPPKTSR